MYENLIARLEATTKGSRELDGEIFRAVNHGGFDRLLHYTTSLDDALTLVPDGWFYMLISGRPEFGYRCDLGRDELKHEVRIHFDDPAVLKAHGQTPPLSLCIAALRARTGEGR